MKEKKTHCLRLLGLCLLLMAQAPLTAQNHAWAKNMGGSGADVGQAIAVDGSGNVYTTGFFNTTADFDPSTATFNLTATGIDGFVSKLDASGNFLWAKRIGGTASTQGTGIGIDASGNVYITGYFQGTTDFDPSEATFNLSSAGINDIFVSKLDASGNFLWAKKMGSSGSDVSHALYVNASGNVYTTGFFQNTVDFDPNAGTTNLSTSGSSVFVCQLDASGNLVWAKNMTGTTNGAIGYGITVDGSGNVYTTGAFNGTVDFDPSAATANLSAVSASYDDIFVCKLDVSGNYVWAKSMGGTTGDRGNGIAVDGSSNVYLTGYFQGTADFDPSAGTATLTATADNDIFVSKFDVSGNYVWAKKMGGSGTDIGNGIAVDGSSNVYTSGYFQGTVDFDPNAGTASLVSGGGNDIFVSKFDASGSYVWAKRMGSTGSDISYDLALDNSENVYTTGLFQFNPDFDPNSCTKNLSSAGSNDIFVSKLSTTDAGTYYEWLGGSTDWSSASNWSCGIVPTNVAAVTILPTANIPTLTADQAIGDLTFLGNNQLTLGNFNLTVNSITGGSSSAYVVTNGTGSLTIKNTGTTATLFPIGTSTTNYTPVTITNNVNRDFTVNVGTTIASPVSGYKYVNVQWNITPSVTSGNSATLAFGWSNTGTNHSTYGFNPADAVQVNHYNTTSSSWDVNYSATLSGSGPYTATATNVTGFSPFSVSNSVVLPVELLSFEGKNTEGGNLLTWTTANEIQNMGFQIERQNPMGKWENIGFVNAKGSHSTYEFSDKHPLSISAYRLRQIDFNGKETLSKVITITTNGSRILKIHPSVTSDILTIESSPLGGVGAVDFQIVNLFGQVVLTGKGRSVSVGHLSTGTYILVAGRERVKFVKT
jgi:hypothetical protein